MTSRRCFPRILLLLLCAPLFASGGRDKQKNVRIYGMVQVYGTEPHTYAVIEEEKTEKIYGVHPPEREAELRKLQGHRIEFTVRFLPQADTYPPTDGTVTLVSWKIIQ